MKNGMFQPGDKITVTANSPTGAYVVGDIGTVLARDGNDPISVYVVFSVHYGTPVAPHNGAYHSCFVMCSHMELVAEKEPLRTGLAASKSRLLELG